MPSLPSQRASIAKAAKTDLSSLKENQPRRWQHAAMSRTMAMVKYRYPASSKPRPEDAGVMREDENTAAQWLTVNGQRREVRAEDDTPLLYVLRNHLNLKGTRFGCGLGLCGACFVLADGRPIYSCDTPLWSVADKSIRTVEGLSTDAQPHPVARALIAGQAAQCGYCMSGIVVAAAALLADNPDPTEAEVRTALDPNLCRCGSHNRVVRGVLSAAATMAADIPEQADDQR